MKMTLKARVEEVTEESIRLHVGESAVTKQVWRLNAVEPLMGLKITGLPCPLYATQRQPSATEVRALLGQYITVTVEVV